MSFCSEIKKELVKIEIKKNCCRLAFAKGAWFGSSCVSEGRRISLADPGGVADAIIRMTDLGYGKNKVKMQTSRGRYTAITAVGMPEYGGGAIFDGKCSECANAFFRGTFLSCGRVSSPGNGYYLEFDFDDADRAIRFSEEAEKYIPGGKRFSRSGKEIVYYKKSDAVEDFLVMLGAVRATFDIMNSRIEHQLRNDANRYSNAEAANIERAVSNASKQLEAIRIITEAGKMSELPDELAETAKLRLEHPDLTLSELAKLTNPQVSKSGLNHRLNRLSEYAKELDT